MMPIYSGDKIIRAKAVIMVSAHVITESGIIIYEGHDLDLMSDACRQACAHGVRDGNFWWPPHKITVIRLEVEDYDGTFEEYERELIEKTHDRIEWKPL